MKKGFDGFDCARGRVTGLMGRLGSSRKGTAVGRGARVRSFRAVEAASSDEGPKKSPSLDSRKLTPYVSRSVLECLPLLENVEASAVDVEETAVVPAAVPVAVRARTRRRNGQSLWLSLSRSDDDDAHVLTRSGRCCRVPVTKLGRLVKDGKIKSIEEIYLFSLPVKEYQIIDILLPKLKGESSIAQGGERERY